MLKRRRFLLLVASGAIAVLWLNNTSLFSDRDGRPMLIAHRGLAAEMDPEHEDYRECLSRIRAAEHRFIENTIPSIEAAFNLGATFVEIDLRLTADGQFAVFHDDVLDCKTDATGLVAQHTMDELRTLDVGYGYVTRDGNRPLRGLGRGLMPTLEEVLDEFPTRSFVINVKDRVGPNAETLARILESRMTIESRRLLIFGDDETVSDLRDVDPSLVTFSRQSARRCIRDYMFLGWTGYVPNRCRNTVTGMYANYGWVLWGWPHRFVERMERVGTLVILTHPRQTESIHDLPETSDFASLVPPGFSGAVVTNRIDEFEKWLQDTR